jgi:lipopolysaccharide transport system permease protein
MSTTWSPPRSTWTIEPRGASLTARVVEVWRCRHLAWYFSVRMIQRRYMKTTLGWPWLFIRPLFPVLVSTVIFNQLVGIKSGSDVPYFLFALVGNSIWQVFDQALMWMTRSIQFFRRTLQKLYVPRVLLPVAASAPALFEFGIHLALIVVVAGYYVATEGRLFVSFGPGLLQSLAAVGMALLMALSIGLFTSVLGAETRDMRFTLGYVMRFWMLLTPVVYPLSQVPEKARPFFLLNPMTIAVELFKSGVFGTALEITPLQVGVAMAEIMVVLVLGLWYFSRAESAAIDRM